MNLKMILAAARSVAEPKHPPSRENKALK